MNFYQDEMFLNFQKKSRCFGETAWRWCFWERCWKTCWRRKESSPYSKKDYYSCSPWPIQFEGYPRLRTIPHRFRYEILGRGQIVSDRFCLKKNQIILATGRGILADFWVPHEIDSWIFQHMLDLWFFETSLKFELIQTTSIFIVSGGTKGKIQNPCQDYPLFF